MLCSEVIRSYRGSYLIDQHQNLGFGRLTKLLWHKDTMKGCFGGFSDFWRICEGDLGLELEGDVMSTNFGSGDFSGTSGILIDVIESSTITPRGTSCY